MSGTEARHNNITATVGNSTAIRQIFRLFLANGLPRPIADKRRFWTSLRLIGVLIVMALSHGQIPLGERYCQARNLLGKPQRANTYQGFVKSMKKHSQKMFDDAVKVLQIAIVKLAKNHRLCQGFTPIAIDGSRFALPYTQSNELAFGTNNKPKAGPQLWVTIAYHMAVGLPWCWRAGPADASERSHLLDMLGQLPADALVVTDAGFCGYDVLRQIIDSKRNFLIRVGANVTLLEKLGFAVEVNEQTVYLWPVQKRKDGEQPLTLRLIKVAASGRGKRPMYLLTSVLDDQQLSDEQASVLYRLRWGVEICYRHIKQTLAHRKLRCHAPANIAWELQGIMLGLTALGVLGVTAITERGHDPLSWSLASALKAARASLRGGKAAINWLLQFGEALKDQFGRKRKIRVVYARKKRYCRSPKPPQVRLATAIEVQAAAKLNQNAIR